MTEYHCWIVIRYHSHDTDLHLQENCEDLCIKYLASHQYLKDAVYKVINYNGKVTFHASALHNHHDDYIIEIFEWIASNAPGSYGLLYFMDDETTVTENDFECLIMRKGNVTRQMDTLFSPRVPMIEDEYDETRD